MSCPRLGLLLLLASCVSDSGDGGGKPGDDDDDDGGLLAPAGPEDVILDDSSAGLEITVVGGGASSWSFGAIEPRVDIYHEGCRDPDDICHTLDANGGVIDFVVDCDSSEDGITCIPQLYWRQGVMSYVIRPKSGPGCWAWGDDAADYYADCTITDWLDDSY